MVHFIRGGLAWACKRYGVHGIRNNGQASNVGLFQDSWEWTSIVSRFSERQLTYKSDTLAALQGMVNRIKEVTQDIYCMGLWAGDFPAQLFWISRTPNQPRILHRPPIPSWSWASTKGPKTFSEGNRILSGSWGILKVLCGKISTEPSGKLLAHAFLKTAWASKMNSIDYIRYQGWYHHLKDGEGRAVGVAMFDKGFPSHDCEAGITCLFLSKFHVHDSYASGNIVYLILPLRLSQDTSSLREPCSYERVGASLI
jgi:hypothetical protein